jgi:hypothetical protein
MKLIIILNNGGSSMQLNAAQRSLPKIMMSVSSVQSSHSNLSSLTTRVCMTG